MVRAVNIRTCAYAPCGAEFPASANRQRYCSPEHSQQARDARRRHGNCAYCSGSIQIGRFCNPACRGAYLQERRGKRGKRVVEPVAVLLPTGCNPRPPGLKLFDLPREYGEVARKLYCRRYERCLSYAVSKNWTGFGCQACDVEEPNISAPMNKRSNWEW